MKEAETGKGIAEYAKEVMGEPENRRKGVPRGFGCLGR
jgi:hypothetical protein